MAAESEDGIVRRNRPGIKCSELYGWPDQDYTEMDSILDGKELLGRCFRIGPQWQC